MRRYWIEVELVPQPKRMKFGCVKCGKLIRGTAVKFNQQIFHRSCLPLVHESLTEKQETYTFTIQKLDVPPL